MQLTQYVIIGAIITGTATLLWMLWTIYQYQQALHDNSDIDSNAKGGEQE